MSNVDTPGRAPAAILQVIVGLAVGPVVVWALINALPIQSGRTVVAVSFAMTCVAAVVVSAKFRSIRPAAIAFALGAAVTSLLVAVVVAS